MIGKKIFGIEITRDILNDIALVSIITLVSTGSFGLGRLSVKETSKEPVRITQNGELVEKIPKEIGSGVSASVNSSVSGEVVVSKNSDKYHFSWCPGAKQINEANKITFKTAKEAEDAGYTKASNCK